MWKKEKENANTEVSDVREVSIFFSHTPPIIPPTPTPAAFVFAAIAIVLIVIVVVNSRSFNFISIAA